jgi:multicomponent Na+:H+ antiporter subunit B
MLRSALHDGIGMIKHRQRTKAEEAILKDLLVLRVVAKSLIPFILMYALYVQMHGEYSPGGGFQAGVIFASAFILYALVFGLNVAKQAISISTLRVIACLGVLVYGMTGVVAMLSGGEFLNYSFLLENDQSGQQWGILVIELGVGMTVFSVMLMLFYLFSGRREEV